MLKLITLLLSIILCINLPKIWCFRPHLISLNYSQIFVSTVNITDGYILEFLNTHVFDVFHPSVVSVFSRNATLEAPLMIVARQFDQLLSWKLPESNSKQLVAQTSNISTSRILCLESVLATKSNPVVTISTVSPHKSIQFSIRVDYDVQFYIEPTVAKQFTISPSQSKYFLYNFTNKVSSRSTDEESDYDTVILEVFSNDTNCMTVSIQNLSCPVFDTNEDVTFRGYYETVLTKGGITIPKYQFPNGFYVVFVAHYDKSLCTGDDENSSGSKTVTLKVSPNISYQDYVRAVSVTLGVLAVFCLIFPLLLSYLCAAYKLPPKQMAFLENCTPNANGMMTSSISVSTVDSQEEDMVNLALSTSDRICSGSVLYLSDLSRKSSRLLQRRTYLFLYHILTVSLFYGLPVIQLVVTYQKVLHQSGEQDLCYYNFLCAHPLLQISDFNHVFSNAGYIVLGLLFVFITYRREVAHQDPEFDRLYGIPQHYGMFYAMGVALIVEGIMSACYHICPTQMNFQFDSSFMYVMAVLCIVKLYQNRHPDINANAYSTFGVLAIVVLLCLIGIIDDSREFWISFTCAYILACVYFSAQIYYMGSWKIDRTVFLRLYRSYAGAYAVSWRGVLLPTYKTRMCLIVVGNGVNWVLAFIGIRYLQTQFAQFLLIIFMSNTLLYFIFYIVMKYRNGEFLNSTTWLFLLTSMLCAVSAMFFFMQKGISWRESPAESRQYNRQCDLWRFYDFHDIWHFLSAIGMFFTFMVLLTLDDDLSHTARTEIHVF